MLGYVFQPSLLIVVGVVGIVYGIFSWLSAGSIVAGATGANPADRKEYPRLFHVVETVSHRRRSDEAPPIYVVDDPAPNVFAAGRSPNMLRLVTTGLLQLMDERDSRASSPTRSRTCGPRRPADDPGRGARRLIALVSDVLLRVFSGAAAGGSSAGLIVLAIGIVGLIPRPSPAPIQLAISRRREYLADASAAEISGDARAPRSRCGSSRSTRQRSRHAAARSPTCSSRAP